jgi:hypothetical protein
MLQNVKQGLEKEVDPCEYGSELLVFVKGGKVLEQMSDCKRLKNDSTLWS